jgi:hypothetical protein
VRRLDDERGFSLTEVVVVCALLMVVLVPLLRYFDSAVSGATELQTSIQLDADGRLTVDRLARELRQAYTGDPTRAPVTVAADGLGITFYSPQPTTPFRLQRIDYRLQAGQLQRASRTSTETGCADGGTTCVGYGPPWHFASESPGPWVPVMAARTTAAFTPVTVNGALRRVDVVLIGTNSRARADRPIRIAVDLRNL